MADSERLQRLFGRLRAAYTRSPLPGFLRWWGGELRACLPSRWRELFQREGRWLGVRVDADVIALVRPSGEEIGRVERARPVEEQRTEAARLLQSVADDLPRQVLLLPAEAVLTRRLKFPLAAEDNLRQVLGFEMDRQTPFKADQVHFAWHELARDPRARQIEVELALVPKQVADPLLAAASEAGCAIDAMDTVSAEGAARGFNLLPAERRVRRADLRLRVNLALGAVALVLLVVAMQQSLGNRQEALAAMRAEVESLRNEARRVADLRGGLDEAAAGANFLASKRSSQPLIVAMLDETTKQLPDDTWLEQLRLNEGKLWLRGLSSAPAQLISVFEESRRISNPSFDGAIQPDPRYGKDRFQIQADYRDVEAGSDG
ncbi:MAG TPA: type II secretion system protein GspL [Xanthomonadaceae bacterium]|nr:type II secretion system protein GspL [Xanthomonadaceae bacterium]